MLEGRKINVELTAGGGGKGENRQKKIQEKNAGLEKERAKLHGKYVAPKNEERKNRVRGSNAGEGEGEGGRGEAKEGRERGWRGRGTGRLVGKERRKGEEDAKVYGDWKQCRGVAPTS